MKISSEVYNSVKNDTVTIIDKMGINLKEADKGTSGIKTMYGILNEISFNRAFNDDHPAFKSGKKQRLLPCDGREYCFYYANGCNDTHVATMLKNIQKELIGG